MKSTFMRPALALALALGLAACAGGKASFDIAGSVAGLAYEGLVLTNSGADLAIAPPAKAGDAVPFKFPNSIDYGTQYAVTVKTNPQHQTCTVFNGTDTAGRLAQIQVPVSCSTNAFPIGGTVSGLTADGLVLTNGSTGGTVTVTAAAPTFVLPVKVAFGQTYGVSVLTQPPGQTCSVGADGTGTMGDAAVTTIAVSCAATP